MYVPASFFLAFTKVNVCPSTTALSVGIWSKSFVQDIAGDEGDVWTSCNKTKQNSENN